VRGDVSSQFLTGLLMALPLRGVETTVEVVGELISDPTSRSRWRAWRASASGAARRLAAFHRAGGQRYRSPGVVHVEGDASSASYFLALGAIGGGPLRVEGVGSGLDPGRCAFCRALAGDGRAKSRRATTGSRPRRRPPERERCGHRLDCNHIPDAAMTLATTALFAEGPTTLRNIASWRVKETDRIAAMATELRKLGVRSRPATISFASTRQAPGRFCIRRRSTPTTTTASPCASRWRRWARPAHQRPAGAWARPFPTTSTRFAEVTRPVPVIAIDGTSASGKGTVAARVAAGAGLALPRFRRLVSPDRAGRRAPASAGTMTKPGWRRSPPISTSTSPGRSITLSGEEVRRHPQRGNLRRRVASGRAARRACRAAVPAAGFPAPPGLVADGRDMGSVVFPDAMTKVFLTASVEMRAWRRHKQLIEKGMAASIAALSLDLRERDERDSQRSVAPMQQSADAELLDTTNLTIETAVAQVLDWVNKVPKVG
jgi:3-phosphoshikimate 1-carboxyvinyltransferase